MEEFRELSVLYAENDPDHRNRFVDLMGSRFGELRMAENGEQALAFYRERPCDLLITDLLMSGMDGRTLWRTIRAYSMDMPIVITSAVPSPTILFESINVGIDGYILKPIEPEMVKSVLMQVVNRIRIRQQGMKATRLWQQTFNAVPDMVAVLDRDFKVLRLNQAALGRFGITEHDAVKQKYCRLLQEDEGHECGDILRMAIDSGTGYISGKPVKMLDGYYHVTVSPLKDMRGEIIGAVHVARDVTELKQAEDALRYTSTHDPLTGFYNRAWFEAEFERLSRGRAKPVSVLVADLDGLKQVNDRFGHKAGDELLRRAAELLACCCRADDGMARVGGDEFTILLPGMGEVDAAEMLERIRQKMQEERKKPGDNAVSLSLGVATAVDAAGLNAALILADKRMYEDKAARRRCRVPVCAPARLDAGLWHQHPGAFDPSST